MNKKVLRGIVVFTLIAMFVFSAALAAGRVETTGSVNIRRGPGTQFGTIGSVPKGKTIDYDEYYSGWYYIHYNGSAGWISSNYAKEIGYIPGYSGDITMTGKSYLRKIPSLDGSTICTIPRGTTLTIRKTSMDERGVDWYYVLYNGKYGWVSSRYTEHEESSSYIYANGSTNIRTQPDIDASKIGTMPKGSIAVYLNDMRYDYRGIAWYRVNYNGTVGWVSSKYTEFN